LTDQPVPPLRALNQVAALRYVTADNAPTYRAIVQVFFEARQGYVIELRAPDLLERIRAAGLFADLPSEEALNYHLDHLVEWGNLAAAHDSSAVSRLEDFYRRRFLYHLTAVGEAAHRAVVEVESTAGKSGSLQASMLAKIRDALLALAAAPDEPDAVHRLFHDLHSAFGTLTEEANRFIGELDRQMAPERADEDRFILYKRALLAYISRFVDQLRRLADEIRAAIESVERTGAGRLISIASRSPDLPPALGGADPVTRFQEEQQARWAGVRAWFVGEPLRERGAPPTVERLAEVAVDAVIGLTRTLGRLNERRTRPVDRASDFHTLARWFSRAPDDRAAHALFHAAFGLGSSRHYHLTYPDPELVSPSTSFWDAPPVEVPVRLRTRGSVSHAGRPAAAADHALSRQWIAQKRRREREQLQQALVRFAGRGEISMSDLATLDAAEFDLLLALLDQALAAPPAREDGRRSTRSTDGRLVISLRPPPPGATALVRLQAPAGDLHCLDYRLEVEDALALAAVPSDAPLRHGGVSR